MPVVYVVRNARGEAFRVAKPLRDGMYPPGAIDFPVSDPIYKSTFWHQDLVNHINGGFGGGQVVKMMHYHPGAVGSFMDFGLDFVDMLIRVGNIVSTQRMQGKVSVTLLATKSGAYIFRDSHDVLKHLTDHSKFPDEGYYVEEVTHDARGRPIGRVECVIKGKIMRQDIVIPRDELRTWHG